MIPLLIFTYCVVVIPLLIVFSIGVYSMFTSWNGLEDEGTLLFVVFVMIAALTTSAGAIYCDRHAPLVPKAPVEATL
jgi:hypothetical protein